MFVLSPVFGVVVGFALGLTGGGGSILAVPMLVYGLAVAPREAIGISLAAVGATALVGALQRLQAGEVELGTGVLFAGAGMVGAPLGSGLNGYLPESILLVLFAGLMAVVAMQMWRLASRTVSPCQAEPSSEATDAAMQSRLPHTPRRIGILAVVGLCTGVLSGLFGVGGGFVIVPALVLIGGMAIHRAVATSLVVITLVSASGVTSYLAAGRPLALILTVLFVLGGIGGMGLGTRLSRKLSGPRLQKGLAVALVAVAAFIITQNLL
jgi:uncharacterized membrane protein YfcA